MIRILTGRTVLEESLERIRWVFKEFETVVVSCSGGKDSTTVLELALIVAREQGRLPQKIMWLDQECEFESTVKYVSEVMYRPEVEPIWYQIPFRLQNATSAESQWLNVWGEGEEWVREKDPISIKENNFGVDRFGEVLDAINDQYKDRRGKVAFLTGVRCEESPSRRLGLTSFATYKWVTWGKKTNGGNFVFHPIYDWSIRDVWKAISSHNWEYNRHYDELFRHGHSIWKMRVSNYFHETALESLFYLQEVEPDTYAKATLRLSGLATAAKLARRDFFVRTLPPMFSSWREYRDYLMLHLLKPEVRADFEKYFSDMDKNLAKGKYGFSDEVMLKAHVQSIIGNDVGLTKVRNLESGASGRATGEYRKKQRAAKLAAKEAELRAQ